MKAAAIWGLLFSPVALTLIAIWTGDLRWFLTGALIAALIVGIVVADAKTSNKDSNPDKGDFKWQR